MTYDEALRLMGLEESANEEDIKIAYREMSQILHPDRFNNNEKLRDRATEQFKLLNEARDMLLSGKKGSSRRPDSSRPRYSTREAQLNARINGILAAREGMVTYLDNEEDNRRNGLLLTVASALILFAGRRFPAIFAIGSTGVVAGILKVVNSQMTIRMLKEKLDELQKEKQACIDELESL